MDVETEEQNATVSYLRSDKRTELEPKIKPSIFNLRSYVLIFSLFFIGASLPLTILKID